MDNISEVNIDETLEKCITEGTKQSFFLFAGAGSGKTHSLVDLLKKIKLKWEAKYVHQGKHVAVITYTNAATDEIMHRVDYSDLFHISTIHSFVWRLICPYQKDIKAAFLHFVLEELETLKNEIAKSSRKNATKEKKIELLESRKNRIEQIDKFTYDPNGDNLEKNALSHQDVIKISAYLLSGKNLLQRILVQKYPILLIDESQDTKKDLVHALMSVQKNYKESFVLGFLGDIKQRIYSDGEPDIVNIIPNTWVTPIKVMNYRCAKRIIQLGNAIGSEIDEHAKQYSKINTETGYVHIFIKDTSNDVSKQECEESICKKMHTITGDVKWSNPSDVEYLILEHDMAAKRLGFLPFNTIMRKVKRYSVSYLEGNVPSINFLSKTVIPLIDAIKINNNIEVLNILREKSFLLKSAEEKDFETKFHTCGQIVEKFKPLANNPNITIKEVLKFFKENRLFTLGDVLEYAVEVDCNKEDEEILAWKQVLDLPLNMVGKYQKYVTNETRFATHQGVKGLEFERVLAIIDDEEAKGFLFSYDKLFGAKPLSSTDVSNIKEGKDNVLNRTLRLLYVICTRAKKSLALVVYTKDPNAVRQRMINKKWFLDNEIEIL